MKTPRTAQKAPELTRKGPTAEDIIGDVGRRLYAIEELLLVAAAARSTLDVSSRALDGVAGLIRDQREQIARLETLPAFFLNKRTE